MRLNPEFRRYLWLELSPMRIVGMPVVLGGLFFLFGVATYDSSQLGGGADMYEALSGAALTVVTLIVLFWGTRLAASALVQEVADKTWDAQRLSSLGPWSMSWGKLMGSTAYVWYGIVLCLAVLVVSMTAWDDLNGGVTRSYGEVGSIVILQVVLGLVAFAVLVQATALIVALTALHQRETTRRFDVSFAQLAALVVAFVAWSMVDGLHDQRTAWFGMAFYGAWFVVISLCVFAGWSVIGVWRRMQMELQVRMRPFVWPIFVLYVAVWTAGLAWPEQMVGEYCFVIPAVLLATIVVFAGYVPALFERLDPVRLRRLIGNMRTGRFGEVLSDAPLWFVNHLVAFVVVCATAAYLFTLPAYDDAKLPFGLWDQSVSGAALAGTVISIFLFVTRDLLLLTYAYLGRTTRRALAGWILWLAVLYILIPSILAALGMYGALPVFVPAWDIPFVDFAVPPVIWPLIHIAVVVVLLRLRWRRFSTERISGEAQSP